MKKLLKDPNARWYLGGQAFSLLGDTSLWLAVAIWVKELTGSSGEAGLTFFFFGLSGLLSPLAGLVVDRVKRKPLLFWTNLASGLMLLGLFAVHGPGQVWLIWVEMFFYGISYSFLGSAQSALLATMLPEELLGDANGMLRTVREGLRLVAPLVGAALFAVVGGHIIALIDAITFFIAAASLLFVRVEETANGRPLDAEGRPAHWLAEVTAGARHIWQTVVLRQIIIATGIALLVVGFFESISFAVVAVGLHRPPTFLGVLLAAQGAGALLGGPTAAPLMRKLGPGTLIGLGLVVMAGSTLLLVPPSLAPVFLGAGFLGISLPWVVVGIYTALQLQTPDRLQGRVYSAADTVLSVPQTFSIALGAGLVSVVDYRLLLALMAGVLLLAAGYLVSRREQRVAAPVAAPVELEVASEAQEAS